jgi:diguanylate cyclase (GGDEF)-like protein/PAS domain S-box-containing protein
MRPPLALIEEPFNVCRGKSMPSASVPDNEQERLAALLECDVLDTPPDPLFDSITTLAAQVCDAPVALVSLIDRQRQWFKSNHGLSGIPQTPREIAFCAHAIRGEGLLEVADAARDARFFDNPLVVHDPKIRFYAGMPLRDARGLAVGALCVKDFKPRRLTQSQRQALESLARLAMSVLEQRRGERKLRESEERFQAAAKATNDVIWDWDLATDLVWRSENYAQILGTELSAGPFEDWMSRVHPEEKKRVHSGIRGALAGSGQFWSDEYRLCARGGKYIYVYDRGYIVRDANTKAVRMVGCMVDVTTRRESEQLVLDREQRQKLIADLGQRALADPDADALMSNAVRLVSETTGFEYCRVLELAHGGLHLISRATVGSPPNAPETGSRLAALISGPQGPFGLLEVRSALAGRVTGEVTNFVQSVANIIGTALARRRADEQLAYAAQFDPLTGLPNRQLFRDRIAQSIARAQRKSRPLAVVVLNLDGFKLVNNAHGHAAGDQVLVQVGERMIACVTAYDSVSRLGADEFAIVLSNIEGIDEVLPVLQRVLHSLAQPFDLPDGEVFISATAGVSVFDADGGDAHTLIKNAELAMHRAREKGRNLYEFFTPEMNQRGLERVHLERGLRRALERGEFLLHYQPKVLSADGRLCGAEALLRWQHPERGLVLPGEFIPILEETGLIVPVGMWVLETACQQLRRWERAGIHVDSVSINLSPRQFEQSHFDAHMRRIIESSGLPRGKIELEITESVLMHDPAQVIQTLTRLKQSGVSVAVDDFGTGYSGLSYLKQLPLDSLKIASNFISNVTHDPDDAAIVLAVISLAHNLGLRVVAEGVETVAQARFLAAHRCDFLQGFHFSQPLDAEAYGRLEKTWESTVFAAAKSSSDSGLILPFHHDRPTSGQDG